MMAEEIQITKEPIFYYFLIGFVVFLIVVFVSDMIIPFDNDELIQTQVDVDLSKEMNPYIPLVKLHLAPSTYSRNVNAKDIDTGLRFQANDGSIWGLFESRTFETKDFGKTFLVRIV